jgi:LmbE family N-acetylglucosaminyl deacetylase
VLCVVAHPDDEVLGVGGTLALHAQAGSEVTVLIMSEGEDEKLEETPRCRTRRECA